MTVSRASLGLFAGHLQFASIGVTIYDCHSACGSVPSTLLQLLPEEGGGRCRRGYDRPVPTWQVLPSVLSANVVADAGYFVELVIPFAGRVWCMPRISLSSESTVFRLLWVRRCEPP